MTKKQLARSLARKLRALDRRIESELADDSQPFKDYAGGYFTKKEQLLKEAVGKGLKLISVPVADGYAFYYEARRTRSMATFEWLYGGADEYVSYFGGIVAVPVSMADKLIGAFKSIHLKR